MQHFVKSSLFVRFNPAKTFHSARAFSQKKFQDYDENYDVIVVGGGHAGAEAAAAASRRGSKTLLVTHKFHTIGQMSCNPSFGGVGKGHLMAEVDALDGLCSKLCDKCGTSYKVLNRSKGPAMWGPRAQIDRKLYSSAMQSALLDQKNLTILEACVDDLHIDESEEGQKCSGIVLENGNNIKSNSVVLTTGTFLGAEIHIGLEVVPGGRLGDNASVSLANTITDKLGLKTGRLKTGTPPRLDARTINYSILPEDFPDPKPQPFSFMNNSVKIHPGMQLPTYSTSTNFQVEKIIVANMHMNLHVKTETAGPTFCPSIESKVLLYPNRQHSVWLEPEGFHSNVIYPQGISTTLPAFKQIELINCIHGLEETIVLEPGYGVEYVYVKPDQLNPTLELKNLPGLFLAGQINGTTGYEEAAAQGIIAGINASLIADGLCPRTVSRADGYIGVLIDDLTTHGTEEPYRLFTTRSEFRLSMRADNADQRLTEKFADTGAISEERIQRTKSYYDTLNTIMDAFKAVSLKHQDWSEALQPFKASGALSPSQHNSFSAGTGRSNAYQVARLVPAHVIAAAVPELKQFKKVMDENLRLSPSILANAVYSQFEASQRTERLMLRNNAQVSLKGVNYADVNGLSNDCLNKLVNAQPATIAAAMRIPGVTPIAIVCLLRHLKTTSPTDLLTRRKLSAVDVDENDGDDELSPTTKVEPKPFAIRQSVRSITSNSYSSP